MRSTFFPAGLAAWLLLLGSGAAQVRGEHLAALFASPSPAANNAANCVRPPAPVRDLMVAGFYTDAASSRADPDRVAADAQAGRALRDFLRRVQPPVEPVCALAGLDSWARAGALLGTFSPQGAYHRVWTLAGAALAFLAIRDAPGLDPAPLARVAAWLRAVALAARPHYERKTPPNAVSDMRNNHAYWAGLAVGAAGIASGDRTLLDWGVAQARMGLEQVTAEGALPEELARKRLALHYHFFALGPLAALAALARANDIALGASESAALDRLARFSFAAAQDPTRISSLAGEAQNDSFARGKSPLAAAGCLEIWLSLAPDAAIAAALQPYRPFREPWLGGNVDALWKSSAAP